MKSLRFSALLETLRPIPWLALAVCLIGSGWAGRVLGPLDLTAQGWIQPLMQLPALPGITLVLAGLGFVWGALAPRRRSPLIQPLWMACVTLVLTIGVCLGGGLIHGLLILSVAGIGGLVTEMMGSSMSYESLGYFPLELRELLRFSIEIGMGLAALMFLTALAGSIWRQLRGRGFPASVGILATLLSTGLGLYLGWGDWRGELLLSLAGLAVAVSLPFWVYEQADRRYWGQGIAALVSIPVAVLGIGLSWGLYLGFEPVIPGVTLAFAALLVVAPAVIVFEICQHHGVKGGLAVALSAAALLIPATGLGLGLLYQGQGWLWMERIL